MRFNYIDKSLVVRAYDYQEAHQILVFLTKEHGVIRGVAKGVRRTGSRFGARLSPFILLDLHYYPGRNDLGTVAGAEVSEYFASAFIENYEKYTAGTSVLEVATRMIVEPEPEIFDLTVATLREIAECATAIEIMQSLDRFLLKIVDISGWTPQLFDCAQCGKPGPHSYFNPALGGAVCFDCRQKGQRTINPDTLRYIWWLQHDKNMAQWDGEDVSTEAHEQLTMYVQWHLERNLPALRVFSEGAGY
ncbi:MAG: DNA repair protein RecO [Corynebacterium sp.]|nr:DNA repair protein RecO [Corynebacterium sp.]